MSRTDSHLDPTVIAHRGFAGTVPENTVAAVRHAAMRDAAMVEVDVRPAADGTPVVFHDDRLEGPRDGRPITDATGPVRETPLEDVCTAEVLGSGETVPTLAAILEAVPATMGVNVELKAPGTETVRVAEVLDGRERDRRRRTWTPFVERVVDDCDAFGGEILFSSFCEGALAAVRDVAPEYAAATLARRSLEDALTITRRYDCEAIHPPRNAVAGTAMATESYHDRPAGKPSVDVVATAHEEGRTVNAWTVENWQQAAQLAEAGVDGIVADYPGLVGAVPA
jgi:glycerophosphoryl diester phosphodiesterase